MEKIRTFVEAGAGCGKTTDIVRKAKKFQMEGYPLEKMYFITFSNNTADEMTKRLYESHIYKKAQTLHSYAYQLILQKEKRPPKILDERINDKIKKRVYYNYFPNASDSALISYQNYISLINTKGWGIKDIPDTYRPAIAQYYDDMQYNNMVDFDMLIKRAIYLVKEDPSCIQFFQDGKMFVDEGQDMNPYLELPLYKLFFNVLQEVRIYTSPSQSIYGFRNANWDEIIKQLPDFKTEYLNTTYRCTPEILEAGVYYGQEDVQKMKSSKPNGEKVTWIETNNFNSQVIELIKILKEKELSDCMVLCRTNHEITKLIHILNQNKIQFQTIGTKKPLYEQESVILFISYLQFAFDSTRDISSLLPNSLKMFSKIRGNVYLSDLQEALEINYSSQEELADIKQFLLKSKQLEKFNDWELDYQIDAVLNIFEFNKVLESVDKYQHSSFEKFLKVIRSFEDIKSLIEHLNKMVSVNQNKDGVRLTTFHGSKGLQSRHVFIMNVSAGSFPYRGANVYEERRLFHVAITRGEETVTILSKQKTKEDFRLPENIIEKKIIEK